MFLWPRRGQRSGSAAEQLVGTQRVDVQAGCLLTQLLRSSVKDILCKHAKRRKTPLNISVFVLTLLSENISSCNVCGGGEKIALTANA